MASEEQAPPSPQVESAEPTFQGTPFEQAIKTWSEIGLTSLQRSLDDQGVDILENQKASLISRKELASRTKTFKKLPDDEKLTEIKSLLKLYQSEIDNLTKRGKFAETSFMNIYKVLAEAPDPTPLLEASVDSVLSASEVSQLTDENTKLKNKLAKYADYENIKAKLMQLELKSIETSAAKVAAKEAEMNAVIEEKELHWATKEAELNKQVQEARNQVKDLRANNEVMQARLSAQSGDQLAGSIGDASAAQAAGRIAELELVASDLERAKRRTLEVEKRNVELRTELEAAKSGSKEKDATAELEAQMSDLQRENILLTAQLESTRNSSLQAKSTIQKQVDSLQRDLTRKTTETESLRQKLSSMQDYQEIKKELEILKSVEFDYENSDNEDNDEENDNEEEPTDKNIQTNTESLEKLMLSRNKKLNNDLTVLRIANKNLTDEVANLKTQLESTAATLEKADRLNHKLEEDLLKTNNPRSGRGGVAKGGARGGAKVIIEPHRHQGVFLARGKEDLLVTKNITPGESVYGEKRISIDVPAKDADSPATKVEYRVWNPFRSKLAAGILGGIDQLFVAPGKKVLYLGAASGTSVSHVADVVGPEGLVYAVEFSHRPGRDLISMAKKRPNVIPIIEDARHPQKYRMLVGMVDVVFADVAQPDQARIIALNSHLFLKDQGGVVISIKANCIDSTVEADVVFAREVQKLREERIKPLEQLTLEPYERDHCIVVGKYQRAGK
ncbi:hypothetical protein D0Z00_003425 [Geotrichum galactomycetum]|uniref:Uncharacterized protein n=1 Tax=Geotrichum galactomycetum TaxID=27317 RepID=A0ACB6V1J8_9ASCO|nr:hypothetical protein D0Z00_003425 [Geotrichum candidum]